MPRPDGGTLQPLPGRTSRAQLRAGSDRISFGVRGRPSSAGRQSQGQKGRSRLPSALEGREAQGGQGALGHAPRGSGPYRQERCPSPGRFPANPPGLPRAPQHHQQHLTLEALAGPPPRSPAQGPRGSGLCAGEGGTHAASRCRSRAIRCLPGRPSAPVMFFSL